MKYKHIIVHHPCLFEASYKHIKGVMISLYAIEDVMIIALCTFEGVMTTSTHGGLSLCRCELLHGRVIS
jgi:hypothetical protein